MSEEKMEVSRRKIIGYGWIVTTAVVIGELIAGTFALLWPKIKGRGAEKILIAGKVADFPVGKVALFRKERIFVIRMDRGLLAVSAVCTHLHCVVRWTETKREFECPCHGGKYNVKGEVIAGPPPRPLDIYPIEIVADKIVVDTSKVVKRKKFDPSQLVPV